jgi:hypothetical protein
MNCPPLIMRLDVSKPSRPRHNVLWLPLFLAWLILAALLIALAPLMLIAVAILWPFGWGKLLLFSGPRIAGCLCALRGLEVNIERKDRALFISFK